MERAPTGPLAGRTIAVTAERRSAEQAELFRRRGAEVIEATTVHTVDLSADDALRHTTEDVISRPPDWLVATTGFGMRLWFEAAESWGLDDALVEALGASRVVARGAKAQSACRQRGLDVVWRAPSESMTEVVEWLRARDGVGDASLVLQLFDPEDHPSTAELATVTAEVIPVTVYRWRLPDDLAPARDLVHRIAERRVDAVTFTSQPAVRFLLDIAREQDVEEAVIDACNDGAVLPVCVGPVCAEPAVTAGIRTTVWPEQFRLVPMVKLTERLLGVPTFQVVDPRSPEAVTAMSSYFAELDRRFPEGFDPGDALAAGAELLSPPGGAFVVGRIGDEVVACGGVQRLGDDVGEIKRMWVAPDARGRGLGARLLAELEVRSRALGHHRVRLDTSRALPEAIAMYRRAGYTEIDRYNDNPYAHHFFEKPLA